MPRDEVADARVDELAVLAPAEDAVVAHALRLEVLLVAGGDAAGEALGGLGLAVPGDVVQLALDREERRALDRLRPHALARDHEPPLRKVVALEAALHGLEVVLRGKVHHGVVLVVEAAVLLRALAVALHEVV